MSETNSNQRMGASMASGRGPMGRNMAGMGIKGQKPDKATIKRLLSYLGAFKWQLAVVFVCIIFSSLTSIASSLFLRVLIDDYITPLLLEANPVFSGLLKMIIIMGFVYLVGVSASLIYNRIMVVVAQKTLKTIRDEMFEHMQTLPIRYFDTHTHGNVMSHFTNDTDTLRQMLAQSVPQVFSSIITVITVFCAMLFTSIPLTIFVLLFIFVMLRVTGKIAGNSGNFFVKQQQSLGELNGYIEEMITGQKVIKVFCHEDQTKTKFEKKNDELRRNATEANKFANILMPVMMNLGNLQYVLIAIMGGAMVAFGFGNLSLGAIASFLQLSRSFTQPINQISQQLNMIIVALAGAQRIFKLMDEQSEPDEGYVTLVNVKIVDGKLEEADERTGLWAWKHPHSDGTITYTELQGAVTFDEVDFGYTPDKTVLHDISLYAEPGQKVAFVGATGAGKTTITNLINRFYDIADGKIRYDGININKIKKDDLRHSLGIVLQDVNLFTGTVMDNIRYGRLEATDEECIAAAKLVSAHDFITRLPKGYNTLITGDGGSLSQGQRQLISIARAAVEDPPVMILDEATSSIDTRTESIVQHGMDQLMKGRTVFVIAHRLSTVQNSDVIMVLENGKIIERGAHDALIEKKGKYYQLYTGAFELE